MTRTPLNQQTLISLALDCISAALSNQVHPLLLVEVEALTPDERLFVSGFLQGYDAWIKDQLDNDGGVTIGEGPTIYVDGFLAGYRQAGINKPSTERRVHFAGLCETGGEFGCLPTFAVADILAKEPKRDVAGIAAPTHAIREAKKEANLNFLKGLGWIAGIIAIGALVQLLSGCGSVAGASPYAGSYRGNVPGSSLYGQARVTIDDKGRTQLDVDGLDHRHDVLVIGAVQRNGAFEGTYAEGAQVTTCFGQLQLNGAQLQVPLARRDNLAPLVTVVATKEAY